MLVLAVQMFVRSFSPWFVSLYTLFPLFTCPCMRFCLSSEYRSE